MTDRSVCILDYGSGNIGSVFNSLKYLGINVKISNDVSVIKKSTHIILPGVGAFGDSMHKIKKKIPINVLSEEVLKNKKPVLGICVGMQVLADKGFEHGEHAGLGWIGGNVERLKAKILPHIGWNNITIRKNSPIVSNLNELKDFYFLNSYAFNAKDEENIIAVTEYVDTFCSVIQKDNIFGVQFHPEKSQKAGQLIVKNFLKYVNKGN